MKVDASLLSKLEGYPFVVATWVDDDGFPVSVATTFLIDHTDGSGLTIRLNAAQPAIPTDREVSVTGSHIRPQPGIGYDERRYLTVWGRATAVDHGVIALHGDRAWGWNEAEMPFFEYSERSVPQSRRYLELLSAEQGRPVKPRLALPWLILRTTRLPFLTATLVPVLLGLAIAARHGSFDWIAAVLAILGGSFAHLAVNVSNDIFDTLSGADAANPNPTQFSGGSRVLHYGLLSVRQLVVWDAVLYAAALAIGLVLLAIRPSLQLLLIGIAGILIGLAYTAPPLKLVYRGLGEIAVAVGFGPIMLLGAYVSQTGRLDWEPLVASLPVAILIALILYVNEIPDRRGDAAAGKQTLVVRLPPQVVERLYLVAGLAAFGLVVAGVALAVMPWPTLLALLALPLVFQVYRGIEQHYDSPYTLMAFMGINVKLHLYAGLLLLAGYVAALILAAFR
jgi:1,4-dihydroxy-2-naphthoate polyprenyltransferase